MGFGFQVTFDCADPHALAEWWADALGWEVESQDADFIRRMIAAGHATEDDTRTYKGNLVWRNGAAINDPSNDRPRLYFQEVPEQKTVKNRMHLDVRVGEDNVEAEAQRWIGLGATFLHRASQGPHSWVTIADPEGNEVCIS